MSQSKVLVDTNSYLRLARSIHPLLFQTFGNEEYCLYVLPDLDDDSDMLAVAAEFGIKTLKTLDLMKLMVDSDHIDMTKVREVISYWRYWGDMPSANMILKHTFASCLVKIHPKPLPHTAPNLAQFPSLPHPE